MPRPPQLIELGTDAEIDLADAGFKADGLRATILGEPGSGKSNTGMLITEQWIQLGHQALVLDAHGEFGELWSLRPGKVERIGYGEQPVGPASSTWVIEMLREGKTVLVDLSHWTDIDYKSLVKFVHPLMLELSKFVREKPAHRLVFLEEAHQFIPQQQLSDQYEMVRNFVNMLSGGRKFGLHFVLSSQRPSFIDASAVAMCNVKIFHRVTNEGDWKKGVKPYMPTSLKLVFGGNNTKRDFKKFLPGEAVVMSRWFDTQRMRLPLSTTPVKKFIDELEPEVA